MRAVLLSIFVLMIAIGAQAESLREMPILAFHQVTPQLFRGARPEKIGVEALAKMGITTIIDLENDQNAVAQEMIWAKKSGIKFISLPMSGFWTPDDAQVNEILATLNDADLSPIFIHCQHGQDRTGLIMDFIEFSSRDGHLPPLMPKC